MFRQLARGMGINPVLALDARVLANLVDIAWDTRVRGLPTAALNFAPAPTSVAFPTFILPRGTYLSPHLIYAYCAEATGVLDVIAAVVRQFTTSERLGIAQFPATYQWLATTEELFFRDGGPFTPFPTTSRLRPAVDANRRNAYYRMFGMDLPARDGADNVAYDKPQAANREFVSTFETLLREVWRAIENAANAIGPNPGDQAAILDLAVRLQDMLIARRGGTRASPFGPNLAREEFLYVAALSWMHLSVETNTAIVQELRATAPNPEDRLRIIGERVGVPTHRHSHSFFLLADLLAVLLTNIEVGTYSNQIGANSLWQAGPISNDMRLIINQWSTATGRDIKGQSVYQRAIQNARSTSVAIPPAGTATGASNGTDVASPVGAGSAGS